MGQQQSQTLGSSDVVALIALIISLAAFVMTFLQVLQQYLASADGFRRCAPSVMGLWSSGTHRRFRRRELRFEVVFETPVLFLARPENTRGPIFDRKIHIIDGSDDSYVATNTMKPEKERLSNISTANDDERASWVTLLVAIQQEEAESREWDRSHLVSPRGNKHDEPQHTICHSMQKKTRSYDFMPPAVTKPYATTTISHLVEMVGMLGMYWKAFEDIRGNIRAEGNGYILTSTLVHGLGLMTTFSVTGPSKFKENRIIPCHDVKELVFGFVPSILGYPLELGNLDRAKRTLTALKFEPEVVEMYGSKNDRVSIFPVTFELIALLADTFRLRNSNFKMLPNPTADKWPGDTSIIKWTGEMEEFQVRLGEVISTATRLKTTPHILLTVIPEQWQKIQQLWVKDWKDFHIDTREAIHDALDTTNAHLQDNQFTTVPELTSIVASHVSIILALSDLLQATINSTVGKAEGKLMRFYFDTVLPKVENDGLNLSDEVKNKRGVIWMALMFRMICWFLLHDFDKLDVNMMPMDLKGSRMPVFIG